METLPPLSIADDGAGWSSSFDPIFHITAVSTDPDNPYAGGCFGDSGGPMIVDVGGGNYEIVGALSFGTEFCNQFEHPAIYTRLWPYKPWIENTITSYPYYGGDVNQDENINIADIVFIVNGIINSCNLLVELTSIPLISRITSKSSIPAFSAALFFSTLDINTPFKLFKFNCF